jgi:cellulose synthase/poly-beta-1,6-N-acetylglucosamine synthase-like glycosyltransferase
MLQLSYIIVILYSISILLLFFYSLAHFNLLQLLKSKKKDQSPQYDLSKANEIPYVTIQLPIYNEKYVVERLLTTIAEMDYPKHLLKFKYLMTALMIV